MTTTSKGQTMTRYLIEARLGITPRNRPEYFRHLVVSALNQRLVTTKTSATAKHFEDRIEAKETCSYLTKHFRDVTFTVSEVTA
jgi:hypothetical protein